MKKISIPLLVFSALMIGGCTLQFSSGNTLPVVTPTVTPAITVTKTPTPTVDETNVIKTAVMNGLVAEHGDSAKELNITVAKIEGNYSKGGASVIGQGGGMWFAAKVGSEWKLVWDGNGLILCSDLTPYPNFPTSMIPECYDQANNKLKVR